MPELEGGDLLDRVRASPAKEQAGRKSATAAAFNTVLVKKTGDLYSMRIQLVRYSTSTKAMDNT